jgi:hypothetical protein
MKKTILIDLDGVLNIYTGEYKRDFIPKPKEDTKKFLEEITKEFELKIFTTRNKKQTKEWLKEYKLDKYVKDITNKKEPCWLYIDDRCINFRGNFEKLKEEIINFKPYYK